MSDPAEKVSLLPCPCCDGRAYFCRVNKESDVNFTGEYIECSQCGLSTNLMFPLKADVREELAERWNRRPPSVDERQQAIELKRLTDVHRGWCNYCRGGESACMNAPEGGCSLRDYLRALSSAPKE